jgi:hypothetical protein
MNVRVFARAGDGTETDVTEGVQVLYDLVTSSMNWGSGFYTVEDAEPVVKVAKTCGFKDWERAQEYVDDERHSLEQRAFLNSRPDADEYPTPPHEHVFSSAGRCMWRGCNATGEAANENASPA